MFIEDRRSIRFHKHRTFSVHKKKYYNKKMHNMENGILFSMLNTTES